MSVASRCSTCFFVVLCVGFCTCHFVMVPLNLTYLHCLQHSFFEHLFNLYCIILLINVKGRYLIMSVTLGTLCGNHTFVHCWLFKEWFSFLCGSCRLNAHERAGKSIKRAHSLWYICHLTCAWSNCMICSVLSFCLRYLKPFTSPVNIH